MAEQPGRPVVKRRSVRIDGRVTSILIEEPFWQLLKQRATREGVSLSILLGRLRQSPAVSGNFTSTLRLLCLVELAARPRRAELRAAQLTRRDGRRGGAFLLFQPAAGADP